MILQKVYYLSSPNTVDLKIPGVRQQPRRSWYQILRVEATITLKTTITLETMEAINPS